MGTRDTQRSRHAAHYIRKKSGQKRVTRFNVAATESLERRESRDICRAAERGRAGGNGLGPVHHHERFTADNTADSEVKESIMAIGHILTLVVLALFALDLLTAPKLDAPKN